MTNNKIAGEVNFRFSSRFSQLIGRNLISNPIVAVSELVKNSYDADSDNIGVVFNNLTSGISTLIIKDDGEGMSFEDISNKWMMVGTDNKVHNKYTTSGRRKLGEKGIGRFSVERLAQKVKITTKQYGNDYALEFAIDWDEYESCYGEFHDLKHPVVIVPDDRERKGTELVLEGLRDDWDRDKLLDLQKELELIRPIDINEISYKKYSFSGDNVKIRLIAEDFIKGHNLINSNFMNYTQAHLFGEIHSDGSATIRVHIKSNISASKAVIDETYNYLPNEIDASCGPVSYEAFVFLKDKRLYRSLDIDRKDMDDYLNTFCGVKIYRDGFRILPFGDIDNDWLELNAQRTSSPEFRIGTQNTIGIVYITRDQNPGLQDVLSRENMYDTPQYDSLKKFVNLAFDKYTALQLGARKKTERKIKEEGKVALETAKKSVSGFAKHVDELKDAVNKAQETDNSEQRIKQITEVGQQLENVVNFAQSSLEKIQNAYTYYKMQDSFRGRETQIYRNIATLGISAAIFGHEALNQTVDAKGIIKDILADHSVIISRTIELKNLIIELEKDLYLIDEKADLFRNYLKREKQDRSTLVNVYEIIDNLLRRHEKAFTSIDVKPQINLKGSQKEFYTWGYEGDFDTIFTNLITNAYKALKNEQLSKYFIFDMEIVDKNIKINIRNNGKSIAEKDRKKIFEPLFSTYSDGTGLGLTIVMDTINSYQGRISLENDYPETHFLLNLPLKEMPMEE